MAEEYRPPPQRDVNINNSTKSTSNLGLIIAGMVVLVGLVLWLAFGNNTSTGTATDNTTTNSGAVDTTPDAVAPATVETAPSATAPVETAPAPAPTETAPADIAPAAPAAPATNP